MALNAGTVWEVRTTGNANNGGAFIDLIPGTSVDYSQQNAAQLSKADLASVAASVTITSVTGGFTASMVGNVIQIRAGGVNFVAGFYQIVLFNSANSVNLDRTPNSGNATGGLGEVGGALISPETFILSGVSGNVCFVKSGTYTFTATRDFTFLTSKIIGYDTARNISPTGNNRPLFALGAFYIGVPTNQSNFTIKNIRFTGNANYLIFLTGARSCVLINCKFQSTVATGTRACVWANNSNFAVGLAIIDCEFSGTPGAISTGIRYDQFSVAKGHAFCAFNFFHDLSYGIYCLYNTHIPCFIKNIFARIGTTSIYGEAGGSDYGGYLVWFNSFYGAGSYHIYQQNNDFNIIYGNTFDSAAVGALADTAFNRMWQIDKNDFWNNGAPVINCVLGLDNIGLDPLWVNPAGNDFNFGPGSPNIDQALGIRLGV